MLRPFKNSLLGSEVYSAALIFHGGKEGDCLCAPLVIALVPLKCYSRNLPFPQKGALYQGEKAFMPEKFQEFRNYIIKSHMFLKTVDTIGNCQRPVFSFGVSQHVHKITNLWKFELNWWSKLRDNNEIKNTLVSRICVQLDGWFRDLNF